MSDFEINATEQPIEVAVVEQPIEITISGQIGAQGEDAAAASNFIDVNSESDLPADTHLFYTSGHSETGMGQATYVEYTPDEPEDETDNAWRVQINGGRFFRLAEPDIRFEHFGEVGTADDFGTWEEALAYLRGGRQLARGGQITFQPHDFNFGQKLFWDDMCLWLVGGGTSPQPDIGTRFRFANNSTGIHFKGGPAALGSNSAVKNLVIENADNLSPTTWLDDLDPVSLADANAGVACGLWIQCYGFKVENVIVERMNGHGIYVQSGWPIASYTTNSNNGSMHGVRSARNGNDGMKVFGADSNQGLFNKMDLSDNQGWGLHDNGFLGNGGISLHFAGNALGDMRLGDIGRYARYLDCYKEGTPTTTTLQIDSGNAGRNRVEWAVNEEGWQRIIDESGTRNFIDAGVGALNRFEVGDDGESAGTVVLTDKWVQMRRGGRITLVTNPVYPEGHEDEGEDIPTSDELYDTTVRSIDIKFIEVDGQVCLDLRSDPKVPVLLGDVVSQGGAAFNGEALVDRPVITGSKATSAALESLLAALNQIGLITNNTT
jgi:hypothetical protein